MEQLNDDKFIKRVESLIDPVQVSNLLCFQSLKRIVPGPVMRRLLYRAARNTPRIGFVIEPYSLFVFFKLKDIETSRSMLPDRYELTKVRLFVDDEPDYYLGLGNLSTRASTFWGVRQEAYLIARDKVTGLLSWIFIDILSNTLIALPSTGITDPNTRTAIFTTNSKGEVLLDISEEKTERRFSLRGNLRNGKLRPLDQDLWLMGNTSIGHSVRLADGDDTPFAVIFDPAEVAEALDVPIDDVRIMENTLFPGLAEPEPSKVVCFPFAQHYIADSPGCHTSVKDRDDMIAIYNEMAEAGPEKTFSARTIAAQVAAGIAVTALIIALLLLIL